MSEQSLKLFSGLVKHTRNSPTSHQFSYQYFQIWLDVEQPELIDDAGPFWSSKKFNLVRYQRQNYQPGTLSLYETIKKIIDEKVHDNFNGKIYLLGNLSYWGYCYNPVSFYFCYDKKQQLQFILSEIHNTPWGERFTYLHDVRNRQNQANHSHTANSTSDILSFKFDKQFHVSPFMPMDINYDWSFKISKQKIFISMNLLQHNNSIFNANMRLKPTPITKKQSHKIALCFPFYCVKILFAIYWQALRLWLKKTPFHSHPKS